MDMLVSSALETDSSLPSFFEMFMTQQVELSLKPAARHAHRLVGRHNSSPLVVVHFLLFDVAHALWLLVRPLVHDLTLRLHQ